MFCSKYILIAVAMASSASAAALSAAAAQSTATAATAASVAVVTSAADTRSIELSPMVVVCTGSITPHNGCVTIPISNDECVNFTGGLTFLNKEVSNAEIPSGLVCTFFSALKCKSSSSDDIVVLNGGTWNFFKVPGRNGQTNFNDKASSFICTTF
ncbi:hypothetical protein BDQ17DRAFT_1543398 [Cyathus striatus]|nr:hypothetical protein BDQ17DRAFT_1543398 [Cyathus striatus]